MQKVRMFFVTVLIIGALVALLQKAAPPPLRSTLTVWEQVATQRLVGFWETWRPVVSRQ
ncbi:MAG: hypothetical protein U0350_38255 [Caldilineaceae bacterium]